MKEKRVYPRYEMELPATLRSQGKLIPAATLNVSKGGICLLADFNAEIIEGPCEVVVDLSEKFRDVALSGQILRFHKAIGQRVAVQFNKSESKGFKSLEKFLKTF
ncbi:MAG: hypothetical protein A2W61_00135 [Deltaproteobacteria bacterium RIFCSPLOWO2_01_44_7]|nr:MAG: hypothetical protein A2712_06135 [Deltaproteobacteria bacterium RIFCSPHIGHO2_01_FULL_43_49]OGQ16707.1 MAG: hypothetical protein A3D22_07260 [Deltaproteobacteria bacterium RIFCSPHIGHO2_02_FULL_44_53]OGQ38575.1 MAG: hypothetical protein A2W61_00135 [Deltaproteobacteria bacterium RIFCSPLOWO2_01_44_7]OGQ42230.1 MAG: hypothetical protein A3I70_06210 [Deltaproteobacteria bacterium RIFCSPLOWO2_02_FULL_44_34]